MTGIILASIRLRNPHIIPLANKVTILPKINLFAPPLPYLAPRKRHVRLFGPGVIAIIATYISNGIITFDISTPQYIILWFD